MHRKRLRVVLSATLLDLITCVQLMLDPLVRSHVIARLVRWRHHRLLLAELVLSETRVRILRLALEQGALESGAMSSRALARIVIPRSSSRPNWKLSRVVSELSDNSKTNVYKNQLFIHCARYLLHVLP
uniref:Secreted RxLR effector protein 57 n=1 Tax=Plasmopara viticola TaxID=143451 RepID=RLR57_PLAVT|nr:RecName: Full=Secreted RxLR effector protein 57; Flags: Precursor [Plasmopara viticola]